MNTEKKNQEKRSKLAEKLAAKFTPDAHQQASRVLEQGSMQDKISDVAASFQLQRKNNRWEGRCLKCGDVEVGRIKFQIWTIFVAHYITMHMTDSELDDALKKVDEAKSPANTSRAEPGVHDNKAAPKAVNRGVAFKTKGKA